MRILERDKQRVYIAKYLRKAEKTKAVGQQTIRLGEYDLVYNNPEVVNVYVSVPYGTRDSYGRAVLEPIGNVTHYTRKIVSEKDLGLTVNDLLWVGEEAVDALDGAVDTANGGTMWGDSDSYYGGLFSPWAVEGTKPNYRIVSVGKSQHHVVYGIREL